MSGETMEGALTSMRIAEAELRRLDNEFARAFDALEDAQRTLIEASALVRQYEDEADLSREAQYGA